MDSCASHALTSKQGININEANTHDFETMFNRLCTSRPKTTDMWSLLASFADVAGINGNSPSSLFTKEALGKGYIKFEPVNAFRLF